MGAGKSTVGRLLAPLLQWRFADADAILVERTGSSIANLFAQHGEARFREMEARMVAALLLHERVVIAVGGGALEADATRRLLAAAPSTLTVYLEASMEVSLRRCAGDGGAARPVLAGALGDQAGSGHAGLEQRYRERLPFYRAAHLTIPTEESGPQQIAETIAEAVISRNQSAP